MQCKKTKNIFPPIILKNRSTLEQKLQPLQNTNHDLVQKHAAAVKEAKDKERDTEEAYKKVVLKFLDGEVTPQQ